MDYGKKYGYDFEHEATYDKICLVNDAVYIAKYKWAAKPKLIGKWSATGTQFKQPYVFKTLFSKEPIEFEDMCETKAVQSALYLDMNEGFEDVTKYEKELVVLEKRLEKGLDSQIYDHEKAELEPKIAIGHDYHFIGKVSSFCPMKPNCGGGVLLREKDGKYYAASGSKGYRWLEAEMVHQLGKENDIDQSFYATMCDKSVEAISKYADFKWFTSDDPYVNGSNHGIDNRDLPSDNLMQPIGDDEEDIPF